VPAQQRRRTADAPARAGLEELPVRRVARGRQAGGDHVHPRRHRGTQRLGSAGLSPHPPRAHRRATDGAQNAIIEAATQGVFDITKEPALAITAGARVFWDNTNRRITTTATGNFQVGIATQAALAADSHARVWLNRVPAAGA
jgi:hypothetical protein